MVGLDTRGMIHDTDLTSTEIGEKRYPVQALPSLALSDSNAKRLHPNASNVML